jgi:hypothetical protein
MAGMVWLFVILNSAFIIPLQAQWRTDTYTLNGGWNGIHLHGDASHVLVENLIPNANVQEVWVWVPNTDQIMFTGSPGEPTPGTPQWKVWRRATPLTNDFTSLTGPCACLVKCAGTAGTTYTVPITYKAVPPRASWVRNGANLLGFPSRLNGSTYPIFTSYFATFPAATAANVKIYKYIGGDLSATNPQQIFSTASERVDRLRAYWFDVDVVGNFVTPVEMELSQLAGLVFGSTGSTITLTLRNRGTSSNTVTLAPTASGAAPVGQPSIAGSVPLTLRSLNTTTLAFDYTPVTAPIVRTLAAGATVELVFGVNRGDAAMLAQVANPNAFFASLLRVTDSANLMDAYLPVSAQNAPLSGLWVGDATVTNVQSTVPGSGTTTKDAYTLRYLLHIDGMGQARLLSQVFMGVLQSTDATGLTSREIGLKATEKATARRMSVSHLPPNLVVGSIGTGNAGSASLGGTLTRRVTLSYNDGVNPFVHAYHPDHDNKDARFATLLPDGKESWTLRRDVSFTFSTTPVAGADAGTWGVTQLGGNYSETLTGAHKQPLTVTGSFILRRASDISTLVIP